MTKKDSLVNVEKEEPFIKATDEEIKKIKGLLNKKNSDFSPPHILKILNQKGSLRKLFLSVLKNNPAKIAARVKGN